MFGFSWRKKGLKLFLSFIETSIFSVLISLLDNLIPIQSASGSISITNQDTTSFRRMVGLTGSAVTRYRTTSSLYGELVAGFDTLLCISSILYTCFQKRGLGDWIYAKRVKREV